MSIMSDARLRLLECRVAEIERRLAEGRTPTPSADDAAPVPQKTPVARKSALKPRRRSRKTP